MPPTKTPIKPMLLKLIDEKATTLLLLEVGLSYLEIVEKIEERVKEEMITIENEDVSLTDKGREYLEENGYKLGQRKKDQWIMRREHMYTEPISRNIIVLAKEVSN